MTIVKLFDHTNCQGVACPHLWIHGGLAVCYGIPETCKVNIKNGYPKEVDDSEFYNPDN